MQDCNAKWDLHPIQIEQLQIGLLAVRVDSDGSGERARRRAAFHGLLEQTILLPYPLQVF
jgi:hypothetical protein